MNTILGVICMVSGLLLIADGMFPKPAQCATCVPPFVLLKLQPGEKQEFQTAPGAMPSRVECLRVGELPKELPSEPTSQLPRDPVAAAPKAPPEERIALAPVPPIITLPDAIEVEPRLYVEPEVFVNRESRINAVNVPSTFALMIAGLVGYGAHKRRA
jgi:hypothetical protein